MSLVLTAASSSATMSGDFAALCRITLPRNAAGGDLTPVTWTGACRVVNEPSPGYNNRWRYYLTVGKVPFPSTGLPRVADLYRASQSPDGSQTVSSSLWGFLTIEPLDSEIRAYSTGTAFEVRPQYVTVTVMTSVVVVTFDEPLGGFLRDTWVADLRSSFALLSGAK